MKLTMIGKTKIKDRKENILKNIDENNLFIVMFNVIRNRNI